MPWRTRACSTRAPSRSSGASAARAPAPASSPTPTTWPLVGVLSTQLLHERFVRRCPAPSGAGDPSNRRRSRSHQEHEHEAPSRCCTTTSIESARRASGQGGARRAGSAAHLRELDDASNALAHGLVRRGVERGDRVVVLGGQHRRDRASRSGACSRPTRSSSVVSPLTEADKLAYLLRDCRAAALITDAHLARGVRRAGRRGLVTFAPCIVSGIAAGRARALRRLARHASLEATLAEDRRDVAPPRAVHRRRPRGDHLHLRQHRRAQGRDAHAPQHADRGDLDHHATSRTSRTTSSSACCRSRSTTASTR